MTPKDLANLVEQLDDAEDLLKRLRVTLRPHPTPEIKAAVRAAPKSIHILANGHDITDKMPLTKAVLEEQKAELTEKQQSK